jgi:DNA polymerase-3 subunit epsilon
MHDIRTAYLDLETTGLDPTTNEILEIGLLADDGTVLLDTLVRPVRHTAWPAAEALHGIAPADVAAAPTLDELLPRLRAAVVGAELVIYNAPFDTAFLRDALAEASAIRCAMHTFAEAFGEWSDEHQTWRWQKLAVAAQHVGFRWSGSAHRAIHDCAATRAVWHWLQHPRTLQAECRMAV